MTTKEPIRMSASIQPPLSDAVLQLRERFGYGDTELIKRGIRLVAKDEGIPIGDDA
jgi:hypothetical protein